MSTHAAGSFILNSGLKPAALAMEFHIITKLRWRIGCMYVLYYTHLLCLMKHMGERGGGH